jgi:hypothetical protein
MIRINDNMAGKVERKDAGSPSLLQSCGCSEHEGLVKARQEAFTEYLSARHTLNLCSEPEAAGHNAAAETFEAARAKLRVTQSTWEAHVSAHHMG